MIQEELGRYDPYTDKFIKNTTTDRIEVGTDGNLYRLSISNGNEYLPKDESYSKADIVAMLTELKLEIEGLALDTTKAQTEFCNDGPVRFYNKGIRKAATEIQQKIDKLNEGKE